jgi:hypothetical protein
MADDVGRVIILIRHHLCKCLILKHLEARGIEPLFPSLTSTDILERLLPKETAENARSWQGVDEPGCY